MGGEPRDEDGAVMKRVPVIVRSWDGPNSRVGLEMDLSQMPWGPFDALGKRLNILLPVSDEPDDGGSASDSQVERALRHVEHAASRCAEFAQLTNGNQEVWLRSQETWEWIRSYLTSLWVETGVEGQRGKALPEGHRKVLDSLEETNHGAAHPEIPELPGAASTLKVAAKALRATPLSVWRETIGSGDPEGPTREEAVQTLLGVARILGGQTPDETPGTEGFAEPPPAPAEPAPAPAPAEPDPPPPEEADPDQVSFDFAVGYDEGYRMGRKVGLALGTQKASRPKPGKS